MEKVPTVARAWRGWRGLWTTQEFVVGSSRCRGWRGQRWVARAHEARAGPGARTRGPARTYALARPSPHHSHHHRQSEEGKGEIRGEGLVRVARAVDKKGAQ